jgi:hypothetical protein
MAAADQCIEDRRGKRRRTHKDEIQPTLLRIGGPHPLRRKQGRGRWGRRYAAARVRVRFAFASLRRIIPRLTREM